MQLRQCRQAKLQLHLGDFQVYCLLRCIYIRGLTVFCILATNNQVHILDKHISLILTHWGQVTHKWVRKLTIIASGNGLSPGRRQAIIISNAGILIIQTLGINFSEILSEVHTLSFKKMTLEMSTKWLQFYLGLKVLTWPVWSVYRGIWNYKIYLSYTYM